MAMVATARQPPSFHQSQCCALNYIRTTLAFNSTQQHHICRRRFHSEPARARIPKGFAPATVYRLHARMARATINQRALAVRENKYVCQNRSTHSLRDGQGHDIKRTTPRTTRTTPRTTRTAPRTTRTTHRTTQPTPRTTRTTPKET